MFSAGTSLRQYVKLAYRLCNATERQASRYKHIPQELFSLRDFRSPVETSSLTSAFSAHDIS